MASWQSTEIIIDASKTFKVGGRFMGWCSKCCLPFTKGDKVRVEIMPVKPNIVRHAFCYGKR